MSQQGFVPTFGSCNAAHCCHLQAICWPQQLCFVSSAAAQFNSPVKYSPARFVVWQHRVFCLCNGSRGGPSIKSSERRGPCVTVVLCVYFFAVICHPVLKYVLYLYFFLLRRKASARRDRVGWSCSTLRNNGTTAH